MNIIKRIEKLEDIAGINYSEKRIDEADKIEIRLSRDEVYEIEKRLSKIENFLYEQLDFRSYHKKNRNK